MEELKIDGEKHGKFFVMKADDQTVPFFVRDLCGKKFISQDQKSWQKLPKIFLSDTLVSHSEVLKFFRGFKPSGLNKGGAGQLVTQMPGKVVKILKSVGDSVQKGDTVLILEAMKMENEIKSGADGKIKTINVKEGQALETGFLMAEVE